MISSGSFEPLQRVGVLQSVSWPVALALAIAFAVLSNVILVNAVGLDNILRKVERPAAALASGRALVIVIYLSVVVPLLAGLLIIITALWFALRLGAQDVRFMSILTVCSYAACVKELFRVAVTVGVVVWSRCSNVTIVSARDLKTSAAAFFDPNTTSSVVYRLAGHVDILVLPFLALVAVGLEKTTLDLAPWKAVSAVLVSWFIYVWLSVMWRLPR